MKRRKVTLKDKHTNEKAISNTKRQKLGKSVDELYNPLLFVGSLRCTERISPGTPVSPRLRKPPFDLTCVIVNLSLQCPQLRPVQTLATTPNNVVSCCAMLADVCKRSQQVATCWVFR